ncbi:hypothetical protein DNK08_01490 [Stutzerimonas kirkiae]|nr:hypothetical protein DNK08_01490 [Stutzerimonas kirkiae]TBV14947.1 hypothetical protein DNK01_07575 [Stutzerimonas kirkiae]
MSMNTDVHTNIDKAAAFTATKLETLRNEISTLLSASPFNEAMTIITTGSYGRAEATEESDLDWFIIFDRDQPVEVISDEIQGINEVITRHIDKVTGDTGTFGKDAIVRFSEMQNNIGGNDDSNESLTRRLLFLLEGTWVYGEERFADYRRQLLEKYIKPDAPGEQMPRFLLNDIIRYYRTIATDFEFKTSERKKPWGLRNIKLRFSRKLIYFSGIIVAAELKELGWQQKIEKGLALFEQFPLERIRALGADLAATPVILATYESFMARLAQPEVRQALEGVVKEQRLENPEYKELRKTSHEFSKALHKWLKEKYGEEHPIHHALVF